MIEKDNKFTLTSLFLNDLFNFNAMNSKQPGAWYQTPIMAAYSHHTIKNAMKKWCLPVPERASQCRTKTQKNPHLRGLTGVLCLAMPAIAKHQIIPTL